MAKVKMLPSPQTPLYQPSTTPPRLAPGTKAKMRADDEQGQDDGEEVGVRHPLLDVPDGQIGEPVQRAGTTGADLLVLVQDDVVTVRHGCLSCWWRAASGAAAVGRQKAAYCTVAVREHDSGGGGSAAGRPLRSAHRADLVLRGTGERRRDGHSRSDQAGHARGGRVPDELGRRGPLPAGQAAARPPCRGRGLEVLPRLGAVRRCGHPGRRAGPLRHLDQQRCAPAPGTGQAPRRAPDLHRQRTALELLSPGSRAAPASGRGDAACSSSWTRSGGSARG